MSTTRSQKSRNNLQGSTEKVSKGLFPEVVIENSRFLDRDVSVAGPSNAKSPRIENSVLDVLVSLLASLREEIDSDIKTLLKESQRGVLKLLKTRTGESVRDEDENALENETRSFYTATNLVRVNSTQNNDPSTSRNRNCLNKAGQCSWDTLEFFEHPFGCKISTKSERGSFGDKKKLSKKSHKPGIPKPKKLVKCESQTQVLLLRRHRKILINLCAKWQ